MTIRLRCVAALAVLPALLLSNVSAGRAQPPGNQAKPLSGKLTDPRGDVTPSAQLPMPPDLVAATIEVSQGLLTLTISFPRGTLSPLTSLTVYLDTDEDPSTGEATFRTDKSPIGADFVIRGLQPDEPARASLTHQEGGRQDFNGIVTVTTPAPDTRRIELPLSRLGRDDGRMTFKVICAQVVTATQIDHRSTQTIVYADTMPNAGGSPASSDEAGFFARHRNFPHRTVTHTPDGVAAPPALHLREAECNVQRSLGWPRQPSRPPRNSDSPACIA